MPRLSDQDHGVEKPIPDIIALPADIFLLVTDAILEVESLDMNKGVGKGLTIYDHIKFFDENEFWWQLSDEVKLNRGAFERWRDLARFGATCKTLYSMVTPILYRSDTKYNYSSALMISARKGVLSAVLRSLEYGKADPNMEDHTLFFHWARCDEERPACSRCRRLKYVCPSYPDEWTLVLRQQDTHAKEHVRKRVERAQRRRAEAGGGQLQGRNISSPPPAWTPFVGPETPSVYKFFTDYTSRSGIAYLTSLKDCYALQPASCLANAIHAAALASVARQRSEVGLMDRARLTYGQAIRQVNRAIQDEGLARDDLVLVSLFVMGFYQLADLFTTSYMIPPLWFELEAFINSLDQVSLLDPLVRRPVDVKIRFISGVLVAQDLQDAANNITFDPEFDGPPPAVFNALISISSATHAAVARCLYLTVRLHIFEIISKATSDSLDDMSMHLDQQLLSMPAAGPSLVNELGKALGCDGGSTHNSPGAGMLVFFLLWPMTAMLQSNLVDEYSKGWVAWRLRELGAACGFGLAETIVSQMMPSGAQIEPAT
ncbi:hypothetical protein CGCVW01_v004587 [Colletotrichum viniferum]|nr:hypothetical protein CGCVW01_v004587 [Colletotrichum viniferum]